MKDAGGTVKCGLPGVGKEAERNTLKTVSKQIIAAYRKRLELTQSEFSTRYDFNVARVWD